MALRSASTLLVTPWALVGAATSTEWRVGRPLDDTCQLVCGAQQPPLYCNHLIWPANEAGMQIIADAIGVSCASFSQVFTPANVTPWVDSAHRCAYPATQSGTCDYANSDAGVRLICPCQSLTAQEAQTLGLQLYTPSSPSGLTLTSTATAIPTSTTSEAMSETAAGTANVTIADDAAAAIEKEQRQQEAATSTATVTIADDAAAAIDTGFDRPVRGSMPPDVPATDLGSVQVALQSSIYRMELSGQAGLSGGAVAGSLATATAAATAAVAIATAASLVISSRQRRQGGHQDASLATGAE